MSASGRTPMPSSIPSVRLQPSLFDRLADELAPALARLDVARGALEGFLDEPQRAALAGLLQEDRADDRQPVTPASGVLADLDGKARILLDRVLELERARRFDLRRTVVLSSTQLRAAVLRDLRNLLNTTAAESQPDGTTALLEPWPAVQASVVNYGIPAVAGRVRTHDDLAELAGRIEQAIERHEPRLRRVRVRPGEATGSDLGALGRPIDLIIEGELWGYPVSEHLLVRTILDLDAGRIEILDQDRAT